MNQTFEDRDENNNIKKIPPRIQFYNLNDMSNMHTIKNSKSYLPGLNSGNNLDDVFLFHKQTGGKASEKLKYLKVQRPYHPEPESFKSTKEEQSSFKRQVILFMIFLVIYLTAFIGNSLLVLVSSVDLALQTPMYFFPRSPSLMDIGYTTVIIPKMLTNSLPKNQSVSFGGCAAQMYFAFFCGPSACLILTAMAYDRYAAIRDPLHYFPIMNWKLCLQLSLASWLSGIPVATVQTTMMFTLPFCEPNVINHFFCDSPPLLELMFTDVFAIEVYSVTASVIVLILPFGVIIAFCIHILITILKMSSAEGRCKDFFSCSSHLIVVSLYFGAAGSTYFRVKYSYSLETKKLLSLSYTVFTPMLNPLAYSLRSQEVKGTLKRIIGKKIFPQELGGSDLRW
ncbi:olfactory receptor 10A7-like [Tachyglossus aculeatus]|uniref:olfactory receptor 10A7-like n=1 Tax=Tachyglossus aculeatus TaxID=9261 RepID=UPI0018F66D1A|nr:olfactory receptor 10A7-like [Tachyglossus aculeatus]